MIDGLAAVLGERAPHEVRLKVERLDPSGAPDSWAIDWVRRHAIGGGWVQLAGQVLARRAEDIGWVDRRDQQGELKGMVLSAEGIDGDGRCWRLRRLGEGLAVWRATEGAGEPALRFDRSYRTTAPFGGAMTGVEYWVRRARPELRIDGGSGEAWVPYFACFAGWEGQDGR